MEGAARSRQWSVSMVGSVAFARLHRLLSEGGGAYRWGRECERWAVGQILRHPNGGDWKLIERLGPEPFADWLGEVVYAPAHLGTPVGTQRTFHREYMDRTFTVVAPADCTEQVEAGGSGEFLDDYEISALAKQVIERLEVREAEAKDKVDRRINQLGSRVNDDEDALIAYTEKRIYRDAILTVSDTDLERHVYRTEAATPEVEEGVSGEVVVRWTRREELAVVGVCKDGQLRTLDASDTPPTSVPSGGDEVEQRRRVEAEDGRLVPHDLRDLAESFREAAGGDPDEEIAPELLDEAADEIDRLRDSRLTKEAVAEKLLNKGAIEAAAAEAFRSWSGRTDPVDWPTDAGSTANHWREVVPATISAALDAGFKEEGTDG